MQRRLSNQTSLHYAAPHDRGLQACITNASIGATQIIFGVPTLRAPSVHYGSDVENNNSTKIVEYNFSWVLAGRYLLGWKDTAFSWHILLWTLLSCVFATLVGLTVCPGGNHQAFWGSKNTCLPLDPGANWLFMTTLVSFLLTIFTSMIFNRWWTMREKTSAIIGRTNNLTAVVTACITGDAPEIHATHNTIIRYLNVTHGLMYALFRAEEKLKLSRLHKAGLLTDDELSFLETTPNVCWSVVLTWVTHTLRACARHGWLVHSVTMLPYMLADLQTIRGLITDITAFLTCQIPYPYVSLLIFITKVHLFLVHVYAAALIGPNLWTHSLQGKDKVVLGYCVLIFNCLIYNALLAIADMLYNPFGDDRADFPIHAYLEAIKKATNHTLRAASVLPAAVRVVQQGLTKPGFQAPLGGKQGSGESDETDGGFREPGSGDLELHAALSAAHSADPLLLPMVPSIHTMSAKQ